MSQLDIFRLDDRVAFVAGGGGAIGMPWHRLVLLPLPHGQGSLRLTLGICSSQISTNSSQSPNFITKCAVWKGRGILPNRIPLCNAL